MATEKAKIVIEADGKGAVKVFKQVGNELKSVNVGVDKTKSKFSGLSAGLDKAKFAFLGIAGGLTAAGIAAVKTANDFEQWRVAFSTMLGSADKADVLLGKITDFAAKTPFDLPQVVEGSKRLLAYNISAEKIIPTFENLGNIAAGVGTDKLPQLITAFGQVSAKGKLMGQELLQFTEAGVNLGGELQKQFNVSRGELEKMISTGKVGFADVEKALASLGGEGGKFGGLMAKQSQTLGGQLSNLKDNIIRLGLAFGNDLLPMVKSVSSAFLKITEMFTKMSPETRQIILTLAGVTASFSALAAGAGIWIKIAPAIAMAFKIATGPVGLIVAGITAAILIFQNWEKVVIMFKAIWTASINILKDVFVNFMGVLNSGFDVIKKFFTGDFSGAIESGKQLMVSLQEGATQNMESIKENVASAIEEMTVIFDTQRESEIEKKILFNETVDNLNQEALDKEKAKLAEAEAMRRIHNAKRLKEITTEQMKEKKAQEKHWTFQILGNKLTAEKRMAADQAVADMFGNLSNLMNTKSKEAFAIGKAAAIAQATIQTYLGATAAFTGMTTAIPGPVGIALGVAAAAAAVASGLANVSRIASTQMPAAQFGGIIPGTPQGTPVVAGENNAREGIIPLEGEGLEALQAALGGSGGGNTINISGNTFVGTTDDISDELAMMIDEKLEDLRRRQSSSFTVGLEENFQTV